MKGIQGQAPTVLEKSIKSPLFLPNLVFQGYPAWPALVDDDPDTETFYWPDSDEESFQPEWYKFFFRVTFHNIFKLDTQYSGDLNNEHLNNGNI